jgi:NADH-quinone oxidoreductase subunit C
MNTEVNSKFLGLVQDKLSSQIVSSELNLGDVVVTVKQAQLFDFLQVLKLDSELKFNMFLSVTIVDWMDKKDERFEIVYHLLSLSNNCRIRVKASIPEANPEVESVTSLWSGANFMEREVYDMYGIKFRNHPDLRRILMYEEFVGHPLRKDYPLQGKQPRIPLRYPEVHNTARDMQRPDLVKIGKRYSSARTQPLMSSEEMNMSTKK